MTTIAGKRALITGGAQGIGFALAEQLAGEGAELVLTDVNAEALEEARSALSGRVSAFALDVTDLEAIREVRESIVGEVGPIDILVNNAGVVFGGPFLDVPIERHHLTYQVNTLGLVSVTHAFLPQLIARSEAHLVNVASASGYLALPKGSTYASSKWAVIGFSESLRVELSRAGHRHVGVTTVCPSYVSTGMFDGVKPPLLTPMLTPQRLASQIVKAIKRGQLFVNEPWMVKLTPALMGVLPRRASDLIADLLGASASMNTWRGR